MVFDRDAEHVTEIYDIQYIAMYTVAGLQTARLRTYSTCISVVTELVAKIENN